MSTERKPEHTELFSLDEVAAGLDQVERERRPIEALSDTSAVRQLYDAERTRYHDLEESTRSPQFAEKRMALELRAGIERRMSVMRTFVALQNQLTDYGWSAERAVTMTHHTLDTQFSLARLDSTDSIFGTISDVAEAARVDALNAGPEASSSD